jgi:hypothetical protein
MKHIIQTEMNINEMWTSNFPHPQNHWAIAATKFQNVVHGWEAPSISFPQA